MLQVHRFNFHVQFMSTRIKNRLTNSRWNVYYLERRKFTSFMKSKWPKLCFNVTMAALVNFWPILHTKESMNIKCLFSLNLWPKLDQCASWRVKHYIRLNSVIYSLFMNWVIIKTTCLRRSTNWLICFLLSYIFQCSSVLKCGLFLVPDRMNLHSFSQDLKSKWSSTGV